MKNLSIVILAVCGIVNTTMAQTRSEQEMQAIAANHLYGAMARGTHGSDNLKPQQLFKTDMLAAYSDDTRGCVFVSRDALFQPVMGWTDRPLAGQVLPDGLQWWVNTMTETMLQKKAANSFSTIMKAQATVVEPLVTTRWAQDTPYNDRCPKADTWTGKRAQTGCIATAMAQVMNFHKYPEQGKGSGYYTLNGGSKQNKSVSSVYDWANMKDTYSATSEKKDETTDAVATLMYDCGLASGMAYTAQASGATSPNAAAGLVNNFSYDDAALHCIYRTFTNDETWLQTIYNELEASRPVMYMSTDGTYGAHAFVIDGCRADGYVHVNWGWSGDANGYFDFFNLTPQTAYQQAYGMQGYDFSKDVASQSMITGIIPAGKESFNYEAYWCMDGEETIKVDGDSIKVELPTLINYHFLEFRGLVGLCIENVATGKSPIQPFYYTAWGEEPVGSLQGWKAMSIPYYKYVTDQLEDGDYNLFLVAWHEKAIGKSNPQYLRFPARNDGKENYNIWRMTKKDGHLTISKQEVPVVSAITAVEVAPVSAKAAYDLLGRRANGTMNGIIIKDGKKYFK